MRKTVILAGSSHPTLSLAITERLGVSPGKVILSKFSNFETNVEIKESVRNVDVYIIQSGCGSVNDNFIELLIMISACKTASALKVTAVIPFFPYSRQPDAPYQKSDQGGYKMWAARPGTLVAQLLTSAGVDHVITLDLHDPQFQGFFDNIPVDNLYSMPLMIRYIVREIANYKQAIIVSPDAGGAKRRDFALIHKDRKRTGDEEGVDMILVGDVRGRPAIIIDDIADTSFTIVEAARVLKNNGAVRIYALVTHGILSGDASERITESPIDEIIVSNSIPQEEHKARCPKLKVFDIGALFAEAIRRIHNGESLSALWNLF